MAVSDSQPHFWEITPQTEWPGLGLWDQLLGRPVTGAVSAREGQAEQAEPSTRPPGRLGHQPARPPHGLFWRAAPLEPGLLPQAQRLDPTPSPPQLGTRTPAQEPLSKQEGGGPSG